MDEDLEYYHLKELHCSAQCHTQMSLWIISRGVVLLILLMEYKVLRDSLLHRSSINNSASTLWDIELNSPCDLHAQLAQDLRKVGVELVPRVKG
ncbi:hypothetical protein Tco_0214335 [Tanacetum coccineum]